MRALGFGLGLGVGTWRRRRRVAGGSAPLAPLVNPLIAGLGASRVRQSGVGLSGTANELTGGGLSWMRALEPRLRFTNWFENGANENSFDMNGMLFAADGNSFITMRTRVPKLLASRADIVVMDLASGSLQFTNPDGSPFTVAAYCDQAKNIASLLKAGGKRVCIMSLVERPTSVGGPWGAGAAPRLMIPAINAEMQSWCASEGMVYADIRSVLVDLNDPDRNPLPFGVRDGTHWSTQGGYAVAKVINAAIAPWVATSPAASLITGANLLTNPTFAGTGGTITGAGLSGQVPDNWTLARAASSTSVATVAASVIDIAGTRWLRLLIDSSAMASDKCEGVTLSGVVAPATINTWYAARAEVDVKAWAGWRTAARVAIGVGAGASALSGINPSGTVMWSPEFSLLPMQWPTEAYRVRPETFVARATSTTGVFNVHVFFGQASGIGEILIALPVMGSTADPNALMFDAADTTPISITSPAAMTEPENNGAFTRQLTTNKPRARWSLSGADAALFSVDNFGLLTGPEFDFEAPADTGANNVYDLTITATDFNPANGTANQTATITVTDVDDGFSDNFDRGNEVLDASPNWTRTGTGTGTMTVNTNRVSSTSGTGRVFYAAPQQGDTHQLEIRFTQRTSATSNGPQAVICGLDSENWLAVRPTATGLMRLMRLDAGVSTNIGDALYYTPFVPGQRIIAQLIGTTVRIYQNGVLIGEFTGVTVPSAWKRSGWIAGSGVSNPHADNWNNRVAAPIVPRVGLRALTVTPTTHVASSGDYAGTANNRTEGSGIDVASVTGPGGTWIADGALLRCIAPLAGTHNVTLTETFPGAVNNGRQSVVTVTVT